MPKVLSLIVGASILGLAGVSNAAEPVTIAATTELVVLTNEQMDQVTAGVFLVVDGVNLLDINKNLYIRQGLTTRYREYIGGAVWQGDITYYPGVGVGVLIGPTGQTNSGGYTVFRGGSRLD